MLVMRDATAPLKCNLPNQHNNRRLDKYHNSINPLINQAINQWMPNTWRDRAFRLISCWNSGFRCSWWRRHKKKVL